ncbi:hypothetical protein HanRHA438_Chr17g0813421 [Helianthus annuus]|nr:hypothetical protein HanRHA438_Chr17g0813421 [Helianthus annuus]
MDGVNEPDENGKISNLLDTDAENKPLDESRKTSQTTVTKMTFYSIKQVNQSICCSTVLPMHILMKCKEL